MTTTIFGLSRPGALTRRVAAQAARAMLGRRARTVAPEEDDLADVVRRYGSLEAYDEEQRRCGLHRLEARLRVG